MKIQPTNPRIPAAVENNTHPTNHVHQRQFGIHPPAFDTLYPEGLPKLPKQSYIDFHMMPQTKQIPWFTLSVPLIHPKTKEPFTKEAFYPFVSNTEYFGVFLKKYFRRPDTKLSTRKDSRGGSLLIRKIGKEHVVLVPWQWMKNKKGVSGDSEILYACTNGCGVWPKGLFASLFLKLGKGKFVKTMNAAFTTMIHDYCFAGYPRMLEKGQLDWVPREKQSMQKLEMFKNLVHHSDADLVERIGRFFIFSNDVEVISVHPKALAKSLNAELKKVLIVLFEGVRANLLKTKYDLLCPLCNGANETIYSLQNWKRNTPHCSSCKLSYNSELDKNVIVSFCPRDEFRKVHMVEQCGVSPSKQSHALCRAVVRSDSEKEIFLEMKDGDCLHVTSPQSPNDIIRIRAQKDATDSVVDVVYDQTRGKLRGNAEIGYSTNVEHVTEEQTNIMNSLEITDERIAKDYRVSEGQVTIRITNQDTRGFIVVVIMEKFFKNEFMTVFELINTQQFRNYMGSDVFSPNTQVFVKKVCLLFTDLKNSTLMYNTHGDFDAFEAVLDHFKVLFKLVDANNGAVVKTIGDAVLGSFIDPLDGVKCAIEMQEEIHKLNETNTKTDIQIKVGVHFGPALIVNMNDRIDYFGTTCNLAARTEGQCKGSDIVLSDVLYDLPKVKEYVNQKAKSGSFCMDRFENVLKGFQESTELVRLLFPSA